MSSKEILIQEIIDIGYLKSPRIIEAFLSIDRKDFVTLDNKEEAYSNISLPIGFGQTISQPLTVSFMLELLQPEKGERILDIGSGSGWTSALLSSLVSKGDRELKGRVIAVERILELKEFGEKNAAKYNFIKKGIAKFFYADGAQDISNICSQVDFKDGFDKILCSATVRQVPQEWLEQLKMGGKLVVPFNGEIQLWIKKKDNVFDRKSFKGFSFVPLISGTED